MTIELHQDNCIDVLSRMPDESVDLTVTSPPYNMRLRIRNGQYTTREKAEHFSNTEAPDRSFSMNTTECVGSIVDQRNVVAGGDILQHLRCARTSPDMDAQDGGRLVG